MAIVPDSKDIAPKTDPQYLHGLDLKCRKASEFAFTKETRLFGVEAYYDGNTGNLIFISETGSIGVVKSASVLKTATPGPKNPVWLQAMNMRCRQVGENEFTEKTRAFGFEVFRDDNLDVLVLINETGSIAVFRPVADSLAKVALYLLQNEQYISAEPILRECLGIRTTLNPKDWTTFYTKTLLGSSLLGQRKYADAEPLLLQGYEGMKKIEKTMPQDAVPKITEALERLVQLYEAQSDSANASKWRKELQDRKGAGK